MKLHVLSDLHIEFSGFTPPATDAEVVVLAGDIGIGMRGTEWAAREFADKPVVYVLGNHEYYEQDLSLVEDLKAQSPANVHVLHDDQVEIGGVRFIGSTLWTDFDLNGEEERFQAMRLAGRELRDFSVIRNGARAFTPEDSVRLHEQGRAYLQTALAKAHDGPTVVATHHLPAMKSIAPKYAEDALNPAFVSRLEALIEQGRPNLWIHGHTHEACDYQIFATRVVCNPRGYPGERQQRGFDPALVVTV